MERLPCRGGPNLAWSFLGGKGAWTLLPLSSGARPPPISFHLPPPLLLVQSDDVLHRVGILRPLVRTEKPLDSREAQRVANPLSVGSTRMQGAAGDLVRRHGDDVRGLDPHVRLHLRIHPGRFVPDRDFVEPLPQLHPFLVGEAGPDPADSLEAV